MDGRSGYAWRAAFCALALSVVLPGCERDPVAPARGLVKAPSSPEFVLFGAGTVSQASLGQSGGCALRPSGAVACWGWIDSPPAGPFIQVDVGGSGTCGVRADSTLACWGQTALIPPQGRFGQVAVGFDFACGIANTGGVTCWGNTSRVPIPLTGEFTRISAGYYYVCGVTTAGSVLCTGSNRYGESSPPAGSYTRVDAGTWHTCALATNGDVVCWGSNDYGQVDSPATTDFPRVAVHPGPFVDVSADGAHSCAVRADGGVSCWGSNTYGATTPPAGTYSQVATGGGRSCGVRTDGSLACWPEYPVPFTEPVLQVSGGFEYNCVLRLDRTVSCFGPYLQPRISGSGTFAQVSGGEFQACGIRDDGTLACWGAIDPPPTGSFKRLSVGDGVACAISMAGTLTCWGASNFGPPPGSAVFSPPSGVFTDVSVNRRHGCALRPDESLACWGDNEYGQTASPSGTFREVSAGSAHTCALRADGTVTCWGHATDGETQTPSGQFTRVTTRGTHACALRNDGAVVCWGENSNGQVSGHPTTAPPYFASSVHRGPYADVSAGFAGTCALETDHSLECWGFVMLAEEPLARLQPSTDGPYVGSEGESLHLQASAAPGGEVPGASLAWDFGDGTSATGTSVVHAYADQGEYTITVTATAAGLTTAHTTTTARIANVAPTGSFVHPTAVDEGSTFTLRVGNIFDPSPADRSAGLTVALDCGDGLGYRAASGGSAQCATTDDAIRAVRASVSDKDGGVSEYGGEVVVRNVAPAVALDGPSLVHPVLGIATVRGRLAFSDPGADAHSTTIDCDNGQGALDLGAAPSGTEFTCSYALPYFGSRVIRATVRDDDGGVGEAALATSVLFEWSGFLAPIVNPPGLNVAKAGSVVRVPFALGGDHGMAVLATGWPRSGSARCGFPAVESSPAAAAGNKALSYRRARGEYEFSWKTENSWAGTCRRFVVRLADGTEHEVDFVFR